MATVLICDDEEILRRLVRASLDEGDYDVVEAADGDEALERARAACPDVILLDMMMPGRSGLQVLHELRADEQLRETPVVMLTARAQATDEAAATDATADYFLAKPFSPAALAALVASIVDEKP